MSPHSGKRNHLPPHSFSQHKTRLSTQPWSSDSSSSLLSPHTFKTPFHLVDQTNMHKGRTWGQQNRGHSCNLNHLMGKFAAFTSSASIPNIHSKPFGTLLVANPWLLISIDLWQCEGLVVFHQGQSYLADHSCPWLIREPRSMSKDGHIIHPKQPWTVDPSSPFQHVSTSHNQPEIQYAVKDTLVINFVSNSPEIED